MARLLSFPLFTFLGRISYGMYLWHFPLFIFINEQRTGLSGWPLFVVRVIPTIGVAMLSFFLVERPIRQGTFFTGLPGPQVFTLPAIGVVVVGHRAGHHAGGRHHCRRRRRHRDRPGDGHHRRQSRPRTARRRPGCSSSATPRP